LTTLELQRPVLFGPVASNSSLQKTQIWIKKNGTSVNETAGEVSLSGNGAAALPAWNYVITLAANDYIEFYWATNEHLNKIDGGITALDGAGNTPSMIVTVQQVMLRKSDRREQLVQQAILVLLVLSAPLVLLATLVLLDRLEQQATLERKVIQKIPEQ
jgi:hypothetical protein